ncbi:MAG TPA: glycosyltransferase [Opitutae bacterium]|nr:glycosyltransferase [Opitutae bacterium]
MHQREHILGLPFFADKLPKALNRLKEGGLLTAPAAPALVNLGYDGTYTAALLASDIILADSGLMVVQWFLMKRRRVPRISGLKLVRALLQDPQVRATRGAFWVKPSEEAAKRTQAWLRGKGIAAEKKDFYVAPIYPSKGIIRDETLLKHIEARKPAYIFINIAGGKQEILGHMLKRKLSYTPAIICTGAAIAFLTGEQAYIPIWADRFALGWLLRCIHSPKTFCKRYLKALKFIPILLRNRERMPQHGRH